MVQSPTGVPGRTHTHREKMAFLAAFIGFLIFGTSVMVSLGFYRSGPLGFQPFAWWAIPAGAVVAAGIILVNRRLMKAAD